MKRKAPQQKQKRVSRLKNNAARWTLDYTRASVPGAAGDVFWTAVGVARWSGSAFLDFDNLTLTYTELGRDKRPAHDVTIVCTAQDKSATLLEVHAHKSVPPERYSLASDAGKEKQIAADITRALRWGEAEWSKVQLEAEYFDEATAVSFEIAPADAELAVNGVVMDAIDGLATFEAKPGLYIAELRKEGYSTQSVGVYCAIVEKLPNLLVYATTVAPPRPRVPPVIPRPPVTVPPGTGTGARAAGGVGIRVLGKALVPIGVAYDLYAVGRAVRVKVDIHITERDNDDYASSCCCTWTRLDRIVGPLVRITPNLSQQFYETFRRRFHRTVVRPPGTVVCPCGVPPAFMPSIVASEFLTPGQLVNLPGGPPTSGPTSIPGARCPAQGEGFPSSQGMGLNQIWN